MATTGRTGAEPASREQMAQWQAGQRAISAACDVVRIVRAEATSQVVLAPINA